MQGSALALVGATFFPETTAMVVNTIRTRVASVGQVVLEAAAPTMAKEASRAVRDRVAPLAGQAVAERLARGAERCVTDMAKRTRDQAEDGDGDEGDDGEEKVVERARARPRLL